MIVLSGAGRGFCAGQDLNDRAVAPGEAVDLGETVEELESADPHAGIIAATGHRQGQWRGRRGGRQYRACLRPDRRTVGRVHPELSALGLIPDSGGSWHLPASLARHGLGLALTGDPLPADRAAEWGMIWKAVDDDQLDAEVDAVAAKLASLPPLGLAAIKRIIRTSSGRTLDEELDLQRDEMRRLGFTHDYREGVAAFLEKRPAKFEGR